MVRGNGLPEGDWEGVAVETEGESEGTGTMDTNEKMMVATSDKFVCFS